MNWMLWGSVGAGIVAAGAFFRGAFEMSWDGLPWLFASAMFAVAGVVLLACGLLA